MSDNEKLVRDAWMEEVVICENGVVVYGEDFWKEGNGNG